MDKMTFNLEQPFLAPKSLERFRYSAYSVQIPIKGITAMQAFHILILIFFSLMAASDFAAASHHEVGEAVIALPTADELPSNHDHQKKIVIAMDIDETPDQTPARSIRIIRAGTPSDIDDATRDDILSDERVLSHLPDDIRAQVQRALSSNTDPAIEAMQISEVDVIVSDEGNPHWIMKSDSPRFRGPHRERAQRLAPPAPLSQEAAECVLKTLAKVTTESGTQLLREACAQAYP